MIKKLTLFILFHALSAFAADEGRISRSLDEIKAGTGAGGKITSIGISASSTGVAVAGLGAILGPKGFAVVAEATTDKFIKAGIAIFKSGLYISGTGVLISLAWPADVTAGTVTGRYMTPEGFEEFLKLPKETQMAYVKMDRKLEEFIYRVAGAMEQSQKLAERPTASPGVHSNSASATK